MSVGITDYGIISSIGNGKVETMQNLFSSQRNGLTPYQLSNGKSTFVGSVRDESVLFPPHLQSLYSRNNHLLYRAFQQIEARFNSLKAGIPLNRIGIIIGTSTSGIYDVESAFGVKNRDGQFPENYHYKIHEMGSPAEFLAELTGCKEIAYTVSCACSSGAKAIISAARLIENGVCDLVVTGGVDTLCQLTLQGFDSLEVISEELCNPFSKNRRGINIGEGAALFLLSREKSSFELLGYGESSDAFHHSAPDPEGMGAIKSMLSALENGKISIEKVDCINLHGTGTVQNDAMEAKAVARVFGSIRPYCSSTKSLTGHTLGAAGAIEAAFSLLSLESQKLPTHHWDGEWDLSIPRLNLIMDAKGDNPINIILSNSYAFGGNNCSLLLAKGRA